MKKRKVCFIVNVDWFYISHRKELVKNLSNHYSIDVIAGNSGLDNENILKFNIRRRIPTIKGLLEIRRLLKNYDHSTIFVVVSPIMIFLFKLFFSRNRIVIYNFSGLGFLRKFPLFIRIIYLRVVAFQYSKYNHSYIVQNSDDYNFFSKNLKNIKCKLKLIPGSGYKRMSVNKNTFKEINLGFVGRITKDKGVLTLLKAVNKLKEKGCKINLLIWGKIDYEGTHGFSKSELNYLKLCQEVFQGESDCKDVIFSSFNIFCLPSNGEGLSKSAIEACSYSKPLLLSDVPGNRDMIDGNGFLFNYDDIDDLQNKLLRLVSLSKTDLENFGKRSNMLFLEKWSLEKIKFEWISLLSKIH